MRGPGIALWPCSTAQFWPASIVLLTTYSYDDSGNRTSLTDNATGSVAISYTYNGNNQLTDLNFSASSATGDVTLSYGANSAISQMVMSDSGDAITAGYSYGTNTIGITYTDSALVNPLPAFNYTLNSLGQVTQATGPAGATFTNGTLTYAYDAAGELTSVTGAKTYTYSLDSNGNRNSTGYTTTTGNQMTHDGSSDTFTYDHNGNLATKTDGSLNVWTYSWDYRDRLTQVVEKSSGGTTMVNEQLTYDVFNNLIGVSATVSGTTTQHWTVYDGKNPYIDFNGTGTLTTRYLTDPQSLDQFYARMTSGGTIDWYLTDLEGSIREIVDGSGTAKDEVNYDPFGNILYESSATDGDRFKFDGGEYDSNLKLYRFGDRWQDPLNGKFISQDPVGLSGGDANLYRYTNNDPIDFTDPTGDTPSVVAEFEGKAMAQQGPEIELPSTIGGIHPIFSPLGIRATGNTSYSGLFGITGATDYSAYIGFLGLNYSFQSQTTISGPVNGTVISQASGGFTTLPTSFAGITIDTNGLLGLPVQGNIQGALTTSGSVTGMSFTSTHSNGPVSSVFTMSIPNVANAAHYNIYSGTQYQNSGRFGTSSILVGFQNSSTSSRILPFLDWQPENDHLFLRISFNPLPGPNPAGSYFSRSFDLIRGLNLQIGFRF